jgi:hypothetical protein
MLQKDEIKHELGLAQDLVHFLFLVSFQLQTTRVGLYELPEECFYLFSQIITMNTNLKNRKQTFFFPVFSPPHFLWK